MQAALKPIPNLGLTIEFAPVHIPRHRRLQTAAVATWALMIPITLALFCLLWQVPCHLHFAFVLAKSISPLFLSSSIPILWPFILLYLLWAFIDPAPERGGRPTRWVRELSFWRYFAAYYPVS